ncbi:MAG: Gmad2 immunoglobulin-like domain-containing protein [Patescibacteria group bacterium]
MFKFKNQSGSSDTITMLILSAIVGVIFIGVVFVWQEIKTNQAINGLLTSKVNNSKPATIENFEDCVAAGRPVLESYPRQCISASGQILVEDLKDQVVDTSMIKVTEPKAGQFITSPLLIKGQARGTWFFEASFPIVLTDAQGEEITTVVATAKEDWMTEDFVDFEAELTFTKPENLNGFLIFKKDNPSGLPANDDSISLPVFFQ